MKRREVVWSSGRDKKRFHTSKGFIEAGAGPVIREEPTKGHTRPPLKGDLFTVTATS